MWLEILTYKKHSSSNSQHPANNSSRTMDNNCNSNCNFQPILEHGYNTITEHIHSSSEKKPEIIHTMDMI
jgi:hypothetical protein